MLTECARLLGQDGLELADIKPLTERHWQMFMSATTELHCTSQQENLHGSRFSQCTQTTVTSTEATDKRFAHTEPETSVISSDLKPTVSVMFLEWLGVSNFKMDW